MTLRDWAPALALFSVVAPGALRAQAPTVRGLDPSGLINYSYVLDSGLGGFSVSGRSVQAYRLPFARTLRPIAEHRWGLKLKLPVSLGFHDLEAVVEGGSGLRESFRTVAFTPGVELQLPAGRGWLFKPFAELGFGKEVSAGGKWVLLYATGATALLERPRGRYIWSLGAKLKWNGVSAIGEEIDDDYGQIDAGVDFRFPLGATLAGSSLDSSVYLIGRRFVSDLVFERLGQQPIEIKYQIEVGFTLGAEPRLRLWTIKLPRIGVSYRYGGGLTAYRINFGFPF